MRRSLLPILLLLLTLTACAEKPTFEQHILPDGFTGVYKVIELQPRPRSLFKSEPPRVVRIPPSGIARLPRSSEPGESEKQIGFIARYEDGTQIHLFNPLAPPPAEQADQPMLLPIIDGGDADYFAVGTHAQLTTLDNHLRSNPQLYFELDQFLPPADPFTPESPNSKPAPAPAQ